MYKFYCTIVHFKIFDNSLNNYMHYILLYYVMLYFALYMPILSTIICLIYNLKMSVFS